MSAPSEDQRDNAVLDMRASGATVAAIAERCGLSKRTVRRVIEDARARRDKRALERIPQVLTADRIRPLAVAGLCRSEIAERLGLTVKRVSQAAIDAGIEIRPESRGPKPRAEYRGRVPVWVPTALRDDYRRLMRLYGEESAASTVRRLKAEAMAS